LCRRTEPNQPVHAQHLCLQDEAKELLQKAGGNPLMIRVLAAHFRAAGDPLQPANVSMSSSAVGNIKFHSQLSRLEDYTDHPKDAYRDTIKSIDSQAQQVLAVLYRYFEPLQKVSIADLLDTWKREIEKQGGSPREEDFRTGLEDLHFKNAVEHYQGNAFCPHGVRIDLSICRAMSHPEPPATGALSEKYILKCCSTSFATLPRVYAQNQVFIGASVCSINRM
jgi:hypothetical protein